MSSERVGTSSHVRNHGLAFRNRQSQAALGFEAFRDYL